MAFKRPGTLASILIVAVAMLVLTLTLGDFNFSSSGGEEIQVVIEKVEFAGPYAYVDIVDQHFSSTGGPEGDMRRTVIDQFLVLYPELEVVSAQPEPPNSFLVEGWLLKFETKTDVL